MPVELAAMILTTALAAGPAPAGATETPEPDMLEFLGTFETSDGKWLDPTILEDPTEEKPPVTRTETPS